MFVRLRRSALLQVVKWYFFLFCGYHLGPTLYQLKELFERVFPKMMFLKIYRTKYTAVVTVLGNSQRIYLGILNRRTCINGNIVCKKKKKKSQFSDYSSKVLNCQPHKHFSDLDASIKT